MLKIAQKICQRKVKLQNNRSISTNINILKSTNQSKTNNKMNRMDVNKKIFLANAELEVCIANRILDNLP